MRPLICLLTVVGIAVSGCAAAQGAPPAMAPASAGSPAATATAAPSTSAPSASLSPTPSPTVASPTPAPPTAPATPTPLPLAGDPAGTGGPAPVGSFVLGDSISLGVAPALSELGYPVVGVVGQSATESYLRTNLTTELAQSAPAWVIILGTNHSGTEADVAGLESRVDLIDELRTPGDRQRVYWVTPHRPDSYTGGLSGTSLDAFNAELARLAQDRPWLRIIDFASVAALHPEWYEADGAHLHPDERGQGVLAAMIAGPDAEPADEPAPVSSTGLGAPPPAQPTPEATEYETFDNGLS